MHGPALPCRDTACGSRAWAGARGSGCVCLLQGERSTWPVRSGAFQIRRAPLQRGHTGRSAASRQVGELQALLVLLHQSLVPHWKHPTLTPDGDEGRRQVPPLPLQLPLVGTREAQFLHLGRLAPGGRRSLTPEVSPHSLKPRKALWRQRKRGRVRWVLFWRQQQIHWPQSALPYDNQTPPCWEAASEYPSSSAPEATTNLLTFKEQCSAWVYLQGKKESSLMLWAAGATRAVH